MCSKPNFAIRLVLHCYRNTEPAKKSDTELNASALAQVFLLLTPTTQAVVPVGLLYCLICAFFRASFRLHLFALTTENRLFSLGFEMCLVYHLVAFLVIDQSISTLVFAVKVRIV